MSGAVQSAVDTVKAAITAVKGADLLADGGDARVLTAAAAAAAGAAALVVIAKGGIYLFQGKGQSFWGRFGFLDRYARHGAAPRPPRAPRAGGGHGRRSESPPSRRRGSRPVLLLRPPLSLLGRERVLLRLRTRFASWRPKLVPTSAQRPD